MPRYYCDYCDTYLTHDSAPGRKQHMRGWKHRENVKQYYDQFMPAFMAQQQQGGMMPGMMDGPPRGPPMGTMGAPPRGYGPGPGMGMPPFMPPG